LHLKDCHGVNKFFKKSLPIIVFMLVFSVGAIYTFYKIQTPKEKLPILNPVDINPKIGR